MSDRSDSRELQSQPLPVLFDSTEGIRIYIAPELLQQLADNAKAAFDSLKYGQTELATVVVQANKAGGKTIKPTLSVEDGRTGLYGVITLEVADHVPKG
jgi:hypothetical protein